MGSAAAVSAAENLSPEEELAALIAEQERDATWGHRVGPQKAPTHHTRISLDYTFEGGDSVADVVGVPDSALEEMLGSESSAIRHIPPPEKWTRRAIVKAIRDWAKEYGEPPTYNDWRRVNGRGIPSANAVRRRFGTWSAAIRAAGFEPRAVGGTSDGNRSRLRPRMRRQREDAKLTPEQIKSAYLIYDRQKLSIPQVADLLWQKFGYLSPRACRIALHRAFVADGYALRSRSEALRVRFTESEHRERARRMHAALRGYPAPAEDGDNNRSEMET